MFNINLTSIQDLLLKNLRKLTIIIINLLRVETAIIFKISSINYIINKVD